MKQENPTYKLAVSMRNELSSELLELNKKFFNKNYHFEKIFLQQIVIGANKIQLQTYITELLTWSKKEDRKKHLKELMENFEEEIFDAMKDIECEKAGGKR